MGIKPITVAHMLEGRALSVEDFAELYGQYFLVYEPEEGSGASATPAWSQTIQTPENMGAQVASMFAGMIVLPVRDGAADASITVGSGTSSHIVIEDTSVSVLHATLRVTPKGLWVQGVQSAAATFVDGDAIGVEGRAVTSGTKIRFGDVLLKVMSAQGLHDLMQLAYVE